MSSNIAIDFLDVTKRYSKYEGILTVKNLLDRLKNGQLLKKNLVREDDFYALNQVSFQISQGEKVAIIGPNGAGKSTILKLIQGVASPSSGRVFVHGSVGGLIELGTGLHPALSGRENIHLNTSIYGYPKDRVEEITDQIMHIAELDYFLDVPIKRYSSGMKMRLGFAMAMMTTPTIVLLDEVLAVGDARFKKKSMEMIEEYLVERSLVFVSHSMDQVKQVCKRGLVIDQGQLCFDGPVETAVDFYEDMAAKPRKPHSMETFVVQRGVKRGFAEVPQVEVAELELCQPDGTETLIFQHGADITLRAVYQSLVADAPVRLTVLVKRLNALSVGETIGGKIFELGKTAERSQAITIIFSSSPLRPGRYVVELVPDLKTSSKKVGLAVTRKSFEIQSKEKDSSLGLLNLHFKLDMQNTSSEVL